MKKIVHAFLYFICVLISFSTFLFLSSSIYLLFLIQLGIGVYFFIRDTEFFVHTFFWVLFTAAIVLLPWPLQFIVPLVVYLCTVLSVKKFREKITWLVPGEFNKQAVLISILVVVTTSTALIVWYVLAKPDITDLVNSFPAGNLLILIVIGILFSVGNSVWEEFILKGVLWNGLENVVPNFILLNIIQAALFGILHANGFPRGIIGMILAGVYGLMIGIIRKKSKGMLLPVITHTFADITIFVIIAMS